MQDGFDAAFHEVAGEFEQASARLREAYGELSELSHTARSADGMVAVTVGLHGQVRAITLDPRVYRKLTPSHLADAIMDQIGKATSEVSDRMRTLVEPMLPGGLPYDDIFGEDVSLEAFFPKPQP
ncbi:YbaB/EbfC family nucleoid-associated protein [Nonomuraea sp. NPDC002799]